MNLIKGEQRKRLKKELRLLRQTIKDYWVFHDLEKVYGTAQSKQESEKRYQELKEEKKQIENQLNQKV